MRRVAAILAPVLVALVLVVALLRLAPSGTAGSVQSPPRTIVKVTGDADRGFRVERLDGSVRFTPTWSETRTECEEYHRRVARVRCTARQRATYRGLAAVRDALRHASS